MEKNVLKKVILTKILEFCQAGGMGAKALLAPPLATGLCLCGPNKNSSQVRGSADPSRPLADAPRAARNILVVGQRHDLNSRSGVGST